MKKNFKNILFIVLAVVLIASAISFAETFRQGGTRFSYNPTKIVSKTTTYTVLSTDSQVNCSASSAAFTVTLPTIASVTTAGTKVYKIMKTDATSNAITIAAATGETIGGETYRLLKYANAYVILVAGGSSTDWQVMYESPYIVEDYELATLDIHGKSRQVQKLVSTATATATLTYANCGSVISCATDGVTLTLPAVANSGCEITVVNTAAAAGALVSVKAADGGFFGETRSITTATLVSTGTGSTMANTKATAQKGDSIRVLSTGSIWVTKASGTWAAS